MLCAFRFVEAIRTYKSLFTEARYWITDTDGN